MKRLLAMLALVGGLLVFGQPPNPKGDQISYIAQVQSVLEASLYLHGENDAAGAKRLLTGITRRWERARADLSAADRKVVEDTLSEAIKAGKPAAEVNRLIAERMIGFDKAAALLGLK